MKKNANFNAFKILQKAGEHYDPDDIQAPELFHFSG